MKFRFDTKFVMNFEFTTLFCNNQETNISMEQLYQDHHPFNMVEGR